MRTLEELQAASLPRCTPASLELTLTACAPDADPVLVETETKRILGGVTEYLRRFAVNAPECLRCGTLLGGFWGSFTWGLANGEGVCSACRYPARAIHRIQLGEGDTLTFQRILQYHPDEMLPALPSTPPSPERKEP